MHVSSLSVLLARMHFLSRLGERCFALFSPSLHTASVRYNNQLYFNLVAIQPTEDPYHDFVVFLFPINPAVHYLYVIVCSVHFCIYHFFFFSHILTYTHFFLLLPAYLKFTYIFIK